MRVEGSHLGDGSEDVVLLLDAAVGSFLDLRYDETMRRRLLKRLADSSYSFFSGL